MGAGASTGLDWVVQQSSADELKGSLKDLAPDLRTKLQKALLRGDAKSKGCPGPVDCGDITVHAKDFEGLKTQPEKPLSKGALVQIYVRHEPCGGFDKSSSGHRYDSLPIANALIDAGMSCQLVHYSHQEHAEFFKLCGHFDFLILRCYPGHIEADGGSQEEFEKSMNELRKKGVHVFPAPAAVQLAASIQKELCKNPDSFVYSCEEDFAEGFKMSVAFSPREIKVMGTVREGLWIARLKKKDYCEEYGMRSADDSEILLLTENNQEEEHTVAEFLDFYLHGRRSGHWTSKASGRYLATCRERDATAALSDDRHEESVSRAELELNFVADSLVELVHTPMGHRSSFHTATEELPLARQAVRLSQQLCGRFKEAPLLWSVAFKRFAATEVEDFVPKSVSCECVGIDRCLAAQKAGLKDVASEDLLEAEKLCGRIAERVLSLVRS